MHGDMQTGGVYEEGESYNSVNHRLLGYVIIVIIASAVMKFKGSSNDWYEDYAWLAT